MSNHRSGDITLHLSLASTFCDSDYSEYTENGTEMESSSGCHTETETETYDIESDVDYDSETDTSCYHEINIDYDYETDSYETSSYYSDSDYENGFYDESSSDFDTSYDSEMDFGSDDEMSVDDSDLSNNIHLYQDDYTGLSSYRNQNLLTTTVTERETRQFLRNWTFEYNVDRTPINPLLRFLKRTWPGLCVDVRTLMKTPKTRELVDLPPGKYVHLGIRSALDLLLSITDVELIPDEILLTFNIDGVPLSKSSNTGFWLILGRVENVVSLRKHVFVVGVYYGDKKPRSFNDFLRPFVSEIVAMQDIYRHREKHIGIRIHAIICDAPAKAYVKCMKHPTGFYGCDKCEQKGVKINYRMTFLGSNEPVKDNASFRSRANVGHHKDDPIIENIEDLDMVKDFPLDPLHVIYLGVMKRLLRLWILGRVI